MFILLHTSPLLLSTPLPSSHNHTVVWIYGLRTYVLWPIPSPPFIYSPHCLPSDSCQFVPCIHASIYILFVSLFLFTKFHIWMRSCGICLSLTGFMYPLGSEGTTAYLNLWLHHFVYNFAVYFDSWFNLTLLTYLVLSHLEVTTESS